MNNKSQMGRPPKYKGRQKLISLYVPELLLIEVEEEAHNRHVSRSEMLHIMLISSDLNKTKFLMNSFSQLQNQIKSSVQTNDVLYKENKNCLREMEKIVGKNIKDYLYRSIKPDDISKRAFEKIKPGFEKIWNAGKMDTHNKKHWINVVLHEMNSIIAVEGKVIKSEQTAIQMIRILFMKEFKGF